MEKLGKSDRCFIVIVPFRYRNEENITTIIIIIEKGGKGQLRCVDIYIYIYNLLRKLERIFQLDIRLASFEIIRNRLHSYRLLVPVRNQVNNKKAKYAKK